MKENINIVHISNDPWLMIGDLNELTTSEEKFASNKSNYTPRNKSKKFKMKSSRRNWLYWFNIYLV